MSDKVQNPSSYAEQLIKPEQNNSQSNEKYVKQPLEKIDLHPEDSIIPS